MEHTQFFWPLIGGKALIEVTGALVSIEDALASGFHCVHKTELVRERDAEVEGRGRRASEAAHHGFCIDYGYAVPRRPVRKPKAAKVDKPQSTASSPSPEPEPEQPLSTRAPTSRRSLRRRAASPLNPSQFPTLESITLAKSKTISLGAVLETHQGPIKELVLNEPKARTFRKGEPFKIRSGGEIDWNNDIVLAFLQDMTGHDSVVLDGLGAGDFLKARNALLELLVEEIGDPLEAI